MSKVTLELTENEFKTLGELLAATASGGYRKAIGINIFTEVKMQFSNRTFSTLKRLERKING